MIDEGARGDAELSTESGSNVDAGNILCMTTGLTGITNACFEIVHRLKAQGHRLTFASPHGIAESVERQGIDFYPLPPVDFDPGCLPLGADGKRIGFARTVVSRRARAREAQQRLGVKACRTMLDELRPDLVLCDLELCEQAMITFARGIRLVLLNQFCPFWQSEALPPVHTLLTPDDDPKAIEAAWQQSNHERQRSMRRSCIRTAMTERRSVLRRLARSLGIPKERLGWHHWQPPVGINRLPTFNLTAREIDFPHRPPTATIYVGPMVHGARVESPAVEADDWPTLIAAARQRGQKVIYCGLGSKDPGDATFVQALGAAFARRTDWFLLATLGQQFDAQALGSVPDNVVIREWLPQPEVLKQVDVAINHGGIHTIHESIAAGVPMLACSGGRYDQPGASARVGWHGLGLVGDRQAIGTEALESLIDQLLSDAAFAGRVNSAGKALAQYRQERVLERAVTSLLNADARDVLHHADEVLAAFHQPLMATVNVTDANDTAEGFEPSR